MKLSHASAAILIAAESARASSAVWEQAIHDQQRDVVDGISEHSSVQPDGSTEAEPAPGLIGWHLVG
jgi:hypothetical protein